MAPKISVIVPMYNAEKYIELAIGSMLNQTFENYELLLIDDCSTDRTLEIAKSFNDRRIKIIELEKNLGGENGPGVVRNIGIDRARGDYIYSMDNDDVILPNGLQVLFDAAVKNDADVVINTKNFLVENRDFKNFTEIPDLLIEERGKDIPIAADLKKRVLDEYGLHGSPAAPWNHLYRREFLNRAGLRFKAIEIHDDGMFLIELLCATDKIKKIAEPFYIWSRRQSSITHSTLFNFDGFSKRVRSFLIIMENIDAILTAALQKEYGEVDQFFIDLVCLHIKNRAIIRALGHGYNTEPRKCWEIVRRELEARYGSDTAILRKMMHGYFVEALYNKSIDEKETMRLRLTMKKIKDEVNRLIPF